jgi:outer membrane protein OmpA-like peptidoglycan-associated protein
VLQGVAFESNKAVLTPDSYRILDKVYASLNAWPDVRVEIRAFSYYAGTPAANKTLSVKRANAVREYLLSRGLGGARLQAAGHGDSDTNTRLPSEKDLSGIDRIELYRID